MNSYNAYADKALTAIDKINNILKTSRLAPSVNATCTAYAVAAKQNLENQAKRIQQFYKNIPGDIAKQVGNVFGGILGKFGNIFGDILGKLPIPQLPFQNLQLPNTLQDLPQLPKLPFFRR